MRARLLSLVIAGVAFVPAAARAEAATTRELFLSPGVMAARSIEHGWFFDAELSLGYVRDSWGLAGVVGGTPHRSYLELETLYDSDPHSPT